MIPLRDRLSYLLNEGTINIPLTQSFVEFYKFEDNILHYIIKDKNKFDILEVNQAEINNIEDLNNLLKYKFNGIEAYKDIEGVFRENKNIENLLIFLVNQGYEFFTDIPNELYSSLLNTVDLDKFKKYSNRISKCIDQFQRV